MRFSGIAPQFTATNGASGARRPEVDQARGDFLADARLAGDVHRRLRARELADHVARLLDRRGFAQQPRHARRERLADRGAARLRRPRQLERAHHQRAQLLELDGLGEVVEGARLERRHRVLRRAEGRDHRHRRVAEVLGDVAQHLQAVAIGQAHVGQAQVVGPGLQRFLRFLDRRGGVGIDAHARQREHQQLADVGLVVDDEHGLAVHQAPFTVMRNWPAGGVLDVLDARAVALAELARDVEPQPGALRHGGEEGLEEVRLRLAPTRPGRRRARPRAGARARARAIRRGAPSPSACRQWRQALRIRFHRTWSRCWRSKRMRCVVRTCTSMPSRGHLLGRAELLGEVGEVRRGIDRLGLRAVAPVEVQHLLHDAVEPRDVGVDDGDEAFLLVAHHGAFLQELGRVPDGGERVADLVRDGRREPAERDELHLLGLLAHAAHVLDEDHRGGGIARADGDEMDLQLARAARRAQVHVRRLRALPPALQQARDLRRVIRELRPSPRGQRPEKLRRARVVLADAARRCPPRGCRPACRGSRAR